LTKYAGSIYAYKKAEKIGRVIMRKVATSRNSRNQIDNEKQDPIQFASV